MELLFKQNNVTGYKVAKDLGFSRSIFTDWKAGRSQPKADKIQKIAEYFNVPVSYFYGTEEESGLKTSYYINEETARKAQEIFEDKDTRILLDAKRDLSPEDLDYVIRTIKMLKAKEKGEE